MLERLAWLGMMYAQAGMPVEASEAARRMDEIAAQRRVRQHAADSCATS